MSDSPSTTPKSELCLNGCGRSRPAVGFADTFWILPFCETCADELRHVDETDDRETAAQEVQGRLRADVGDRYARCSFASFPTDVRARTEGRDAVAGWVDRVLDGDRANLFLYGPHGEGKTGLAVAAAARLAERGVGVRYFKVIEWLDDVRESLFDDDVRGLGEAEVAARNAPVIVLDDLGTERGTPFALERLFALVDHRYSRRLPTLVTSNFAPSRLIADMAKGDDVVGGRIVSRLVEGSVKLKLEFGDLRLRKPEAAAA